jgi:hypothetical protein
MVHEARVSRAKTVLYTSFVQFLAFDHLDGLVLPWLNRKSDFRRRDCMKFKGITLVGLLFLSVTAFAQTAPDPVELFIEGLGKVVIKGFAFADMAGRVTEILGRERGSIAGGTSVQSRESATLAALRAANIPATCKIGANGIEIVLLDPIPKVNLGTINVTRRNVPNAEPSPTAKWDAAESTSFTRIANGETTPTEYRVVDGKVSYLENGVIKTSGSISLVVGKYIIGGQEHVVENGRLIAVEAVTGVNP